MSAFIDQLRIGEVREIKLGKSFRRGKTLNGNRNLNNGDNELYHTIRYDFKPASVDLNKVSTIEFEANNKATVIAPNVDGSGFPHTVFKGSCKPHSKECVLIIDNDTGEVTLERLQQNIVVKKTRAEGTSKVKFPQRPITPSLEQVNQVNTNNNNNNKKLSPPFNNYSNVPNLATTVNTQQVQQTSYSSSVSQQKSISPKNNLITNDNQLFALKRNDQTIATSNNDDDAMIGILSESSNESSDNDSSSSDSSSESGSDSSDEDEKLFNVNTTNSQNKSNGLDMPLLTGDQIFNNNNNNNNNNNMNMNMNMNRSSIKETNQNNDFISTSDSNIESSDEENDNECFNNDNRDRATSSLTFQSMPNILNTTHTPLSQQSQQHQQQQQQQQKSQASKSNNQLCMPTGLSLTSMPKFSQLSQDLQLSESGSDSE